MQDNKGFDVFLSHNEADKPWVIQLKRDLEAHGLKVWLDKDEVPPGSLIVNALEKGLDDSRVMALIVSPEAMKSGWVEEEYNGAIALMKKRRLPLRLIPVILRDAEVPAFVGSRSGVDFRDAAKYKESLEQLIWGITLKKPESTKGVQSKEPSPITVTPNVNLKESASQQPSVATLRFVEDLVPDDDSILSTLNALSKGNAEVRIEWPEINETAFKLANEIRADLQPRLKKLGVPYGDAMNDELQEFDAALSAVSGYRERSALRVAPLWAGMQEQLASDYFIIPALRHYLVLSNLAALVRLYRILSRPAGTSPVFATIDANSISSDQQLLMHPAVRPLLGVKSAEVFWAARYFPQRLPEPFNYGITVWAPKSIVIEAYQLRSRGHDVTNGFVQRFAIPQTEGEMLHRLPASEIQYHLTYSETVFTINKILNENNKEPEGY